MNYVAVVELRVFFVRGSGCALFVFGGEMTEKQSDRFEKAFGDFIDGQKYDKINNELFSLLRAVFAAGWHASENNK